MTSRLLSTGIGLLFLSSALWAQEVPPDFAPEIVDRPPLEFAPTVKRAGYSVPMRFLVEGHGVTPKPLRLEWDLESSSGRGLIMSSLKFDSRSFFVALMSLKQLDRRMDRLAEPELKNESIFVFRFPEHLIQEGVIEAVTRTGKVVWTHDFGKFQQQAWRTQLEAWKKYLLSRGATLDEISRGPLFASQFGVRDFYRQFAEFTQETEPFRFCISQKKEKGWIRLCTNSYEFRKNEKGEMTFVSLRYQPLPARVILQNEDRSLKGIYEITDKKEPVQFYAELSNGMSFEFFSEVPNFRLVEIVRLKKGSDQMTLVGEGDVPVQSHRIVQQPQDGRIEEFFRWQATIGDQRTFWETTISDARPFVFLRGQGGGFFIQEFQIEKVPSEEIRPYLHDRALRSTYGDGAKIFGVKPPVEISTESNEMKLESSLPEFTWYYGAKKRGVYNYATVKVQDQSETYLGYHEVFKGYPRELSARLSGVAGSGGLVFQGESAFNYWIEDLLGWTNYYFSRHRWGWSYKYFQSVTPLTFSSRQGTLRSSTFDLKYRFSPGLWGRDESWGAMLSYQEIQFNVFEPKMLGAGIFWARSMPKLFDDAMNLLPILRYPKWVDLEFVYYLESLHRDHFLLNPGTQRAGFTGVGNWALNFHGKVAWSERFFGEAGFGIRQLDFLRERANENPRRLRFQYSSFYGTVGLGVNF
ncbi:MAG: hypothetical protein LW875_07100 [Proteobacteria bacterium]|jgi:hypothetical protein|nr:hypothetical protein [Pseudomonadota bacterium]